MSRPTKSVPMIVRFSEQIVDDDHPPENGTSGERPSTGTWPPRPGPANPRPRPQGQTRVTLVQMESTDDE